MRGLAFGPPAASDLTPDEGVEQQPRNQSPRTGRGMTTPACDRGSLGSRSVTVIMRMHHLFGGLLVRGGEPGDHLEEVRRGVGIARLLMSRPQAKQREATSQAAAAQGERFVLATVIDGKQNSASPVAARNKASAD